MRSPEDSSTSHDASPVVPYRYFDFSESSSSLATATTQMSESTSLYTVTSSGTVPGIGALSGRGIRAVGKLQLRGMEWIVLQAKFANFRRLFPHKDETTAVGLEEAYDDILELTRPNLYSKQTRKQALGFMLNQIGSEHTVRLIQSLKKWPPFEVQLFVTEVMTCLPTTWLESTGLESSRGDMHKDLLQDAYFPATTYSRRFVPVLIFMGKLAQASSSCCQAVLEAGFLDLLLVLCLQDFSLPEAQPTGIIKDDPAYRENLLAIWDSVVEVFITDSIASPIYMAHPISMLWPYTLPGDQHLSQRQAAWRIMQYDSGYVALRLEAIRRALYHLNGVLQDRMAAVNICIDIFELASSDSLDSANEVLDKLSRWMEQNSGEMLRIFKLFIQRNVNGTVELVSRLLRRVILRKDIPVGKSLTPRVDIFLGFAVAVAMDGATSKQVFVDAGIISFILAIHLEKLQAGSNLEDPSTADISQLVTAIHNQGITDATKKEYSRQRLARWRLLMDASRVFLEAPDSDTAITKEIGNLLIDSDASSGVDSLEHLPESTTRASEPR